MRSRACLVSFSTLSRTAGRLQGTPPPLVSTNVGSSSFGDTAGVSSVGSWLASVEPKMMDLSTSKLSSANVYSCHVFRSWRDWTILNHFWTIFSGSCMPSHTKETAALGLAFFPEGCTWIRSCFFIGFSMEWMDELDTMVIQYTKLTAIAEQAGFRFSGEDRVL